MNYVYKQLKKGFIIRVDQQAWQPSNKNTSFLRYLYLESFHQYLPKEQPETFEYSWTAYWSDALIFTDRVEAIKAAKQLQTENNKIGNKFKYQIVTLKSVAKQNNL